MVSRHDLIASTDYTVYIFPFTFSAPAGLPAWRGTPPDPAGCDLEVSLGEKYNLLYP